MQNRPQKVNLPQLFEILQSRGAEGRHFTAIVGAPGAGKSTLAEALAARLNAAEPESAAILPMDGFHYDDQVLEAKGWRARKGAPHTFDVAGFAHILARLRDQKNETIAVPLFDREIEVARSAARLIGPKVRHVIVEGNYLLLDQDPWAACRAFFETSVYLNVPIEELRRRLLQRWAGLDPAEAMVKLEENDLPNARLVIANGQGAEFEMQSDDR